MTTYQLTSANGPCWQCQHYGGWVRFGNGKRSGNIWCAEYRYVRSMPENGCAYWKLQVPARTEPLIWDGVRAPPPS